MEGLEKDDVKAAELFRKAADLGLAAANGALAMCYQEGRGVEKDSALAADWWRKASDQGR
jgi:hypothetical protein